MESALSMIEIKRNPAGPSFNSQSFMCCWRVMVMREHPFKFSRRTVLGSALAGASLAPMLGAGSALAQTPMPARDLEKDKRPVIHPDGPKLGVYDPWGDFTAEKGIATEHLFLPWEDVDLDTLPEADAYAHARGRNILMTIEPWSWAKEWNIRRTELRDLILSGKRDENMRAILNVVAGFKSPVTIRWAQEMENPYGRFTWSNWKPEDYIAAFRRMVGIMREVTPKAHVMWSPRGQKSLTRYWPGGEHVDIVGLTVFGLEKYDEIVYGKPRNFVESLQLGYDLTAGYGKPVWVAELGYDGSPAYLAKWVEDVTAKHDQFPALKEVVYFNDKEVWPWPHDLGYPDWRVVHRKETLYPLRDMP
jgi:endoglucanase